MANQDGADGSFPSSQFPVVFADGVASSSRGPGLVKFYLFRADPSLVADGGVKTTTFCQIVMPAIGFASAAIFFQKILDQMLEAGEITSDQIALLKKQLEELSAAKK
jgi:hypothetical protein